jgi:hypothetical protein
MGIVLASQFFCKSKTLNLFKNKQENLKKRNRRWETKKSKPKPK